MKSYSILLLSAIALAFLIGRFTAPEKIKIETKTVTVQVEKIAENSASDSMVITTTISKPDGTKISRTKNEIKHELSTMKTIANAQSEMVKKEITNRSGVVVSGMVGIDGISFPTSLIYGVSVIKPILGPISIGAWGLTDKTFGLSLGLTL